MSELKYLSGFGNEHVTEAVSGALPPGQNNPQRAPLGLYAEQLSGTAFTRPRRENQRTWLYRIRPSVVHGRYRLHAPNEADRRVVSGPLEGPPPDPNQMRWDPLPLPEAPTDWVDGLVTLAVNGDAGAMAGCSVHLYAANRSMVDRCFASADGHLLFVPQLGRHRIWTECGPMDVAPGEIAVVPRGFKLRVEAPDGAIRGWVCENHGAAFELPSLGPIGANGLASPRHFLSPVATYEGSAGAARPCEVVTKFQGRLWTAPLPATPFDVVAWWGNYAPYKYELALFNTMNTVSFDHPDPSIFTVLTSPTDTPGRANLDFVIFPPRWMVAEHTFRPPYYHRNIMSELMGLVTGVYDAKEAGAGGFMPGGSSLHNCMTAHGPDAATYAKAAAAELAPERYGDTLAFMFESCLPFQVTRFGHDGGLLQADYLECWQGLVASFTL